MTPPIKFGHKEYNVLNYWETGCIATWCACCCAPHTKILRLEPEEAALHVKSYVSESNGRFPYSEIGSVEISNDCNCCWKITSGMGDISPGCGCNEALVKEIHNELKQRIQGRGDQAQMKRAEETQSLLHEVADGQQHLHAKVDALLKHMGIPVPAPTAQVMGSASGSTYGGVDVGAPPKQE